MANWPKQSLALKLEDFNLVVAFKKALHNHGRLRSHACKPYSSSATKNSSDSSLEFALMSYGGGLVRCQTAFAMPLGLVVLLPLLSAEHSSFRYFSVTLAGRLFLAKHWFSIVLGLQRRKLQSSPHLQI